MGPFCRNLAVLEMCQKSSRRSSASHNAFEMKLYSSCGLLPAFSHFETYIFFPSVVLKDVSSYLTTNGQTGIIAPAHSWQTRLMLHQQYAIQTHLQAATHKRLRTHRRRVNTNSHTAGSRSNVHSRFMFLCVD